MLDFLRWMKALKPSRHVRRHKHLLETLQKDRLGARHLLFAVPKQIDIQARMQELASAGPPVRRRELSRDAAIIHFEAQGEHYKAELIPGS